MTTSTKTRETFTSRFGTLMTIIGVAIGLGNVWRFPYMVGKFGGAAFVLFYILVSVVIGVPALMAEFALGRYSRRGPVGAFAAAGLPFGTAVGWFFFAVVTAATGYYTAVIGWVLYYAVGQLAAGLHIPLDPSAILPPDHGFVLKSFVLQLVCTGAVILTCALVVIKGLRAGIERASKVVLPMLLIVILVLMVRTLTLPGAMDGVRWYILKFRFADLTPAVMVAAIGHAIFSLSLGGTFMVVYGSYLDSKESLARPAIWTVIGDTGSALLAGLAVIPAVFALGLQPTSGPGLIFATLPKVFAAIPAGAFFGCLFFIGLFGAGYLSDVGAFEVLVAGLTDNTRYTRTRAVWIVSAAVFLLAIPPTINNAIFVPWDLTFGSGIQTLGSLVAVLTVGWCLNRSAALKELGRQGEQPIPMWLFYWIRFGIPAAIGGVGVWWLLSDVFGAVKAV
ncbi:MAG: sodium:neurotransmitter symporter [Gemmatimonadetes bacterium]|nr:sodium:neurotransmitter symporter [Gemmatimonadota bacterium]